MKGKYTIVIRNNVLRYEITINRNITILKGKSATGKSTLYNLFVQLKKRGSKSGIHCNMTDKIDILDSSEDWNYLQFKLKECRGKIFISDEGNTFIGTPEFAKLIQQSDNYFIFITRSSRLNYLTYSVNSIYELGSEKRGNITVTKMFPMYPNMNTNFYPDIIVSEDSNSGKQMLEMLYRDCQVISASGKDNVAKCVKDLIYNNQDSKIYVVVDGAAFGNCIAKIIALISRNVLVFAPESFEFLLLHEQGFQRYLTDELVNTEKYCDSLEFVSWEQYFTKLLTSICKDMHISYSKSRLHPHFCSEKFLQFMLIMYKDIKKGGNSEDG